MLVALGMLDRVPANPRRINQQRRAGQRSFHRLLAFGQGRSFILGRQAAPLIHDGRQLARLGRLGRCFVEAELRTQPFDEQNGHRHRIPLSHFLERLILRRLTVRPDDRAGLIHDDRAQFIQPGFMIAVVFGVKRITGGDRIGLHKGADGGGQTFQICFRRFKRGFTQLNVSQSLLFEQNADHLGHAIPRFARQAHGQDGQRGVRPLGLHQLQPLLLLRRHAGLWFSGNRETTDAHREQGH